VDRVSGDVLVEEQEDRPGAVRVLPVPGVFRPHSDSLMLADCISHERLGQSASVLDLCTGSGLLAAVAARGGASEVIAVDVSRRAVLAAWINARLNGTRVKAVRGNLFAPVAGRRFDLIVANLPYLPSRRRYAPRGSACAWEAGVRGRVFIDRICAQAGEHLKPRGVLLLVHSSVCGEQETLQALEIGGLTPAVIARHRGPLGA
jgi:release factor glutamine methyltransferase